MTGVKRFTAQALGSIKSDIVCDQQVRNTLAYSERASMQKKMFYNIDHRPTTCLGQNSETQPKTARQGSML